MRRSKTGRGAAAGSGEALYYSDRRANPIPSHKEATLNRTSRPNLILILVAAGLVAMASPLAAQDLSGSWDMETTAQLPEEASPCVYSGDCQMQQDGSSLIGTVVLGLVSGPADCPGEMTADIDGIVDGDSVFGTLNGGQLGTADFNGSRSNSFEGTFLTSEGPFAGGTGTWLAVRPSVSVLEIPTLSSLALITLVLMLLASGAWILRP